MPLGTSCPDHFLRTRISPMFVPWDPAARDMATLRAAIDERIAKYREDYAKYYNAFAEPDSPALRDSNPSVVVIPGLGLFGFGKDKREARITTEFFVNAIHVMAGANALEEDGASTGPLPQVRRPEQAQEFKTFHNYVALPRLGGVPDRVLGARRSQAAADAAGEGIQPQGGGGGRRRQRHRAGGRRCRSPRAAGTSWWPTRTTRRPQESAAAAAALSSAEMVQAAALDLTVARDDCAAACARPCCSSAASTPW